jgi:hypothetical protein
MAPLPRQKGLRNAILPPKIDKFRPCARLMLREFCPIPAQTDPA